MHSGDEGRERQKTNFTWEVFKNAGEKNTKGSKYNNPEGHKYLYITQTSFTMQTLYTV